MYFKRIVSILALLMSIPAGSAFAGGCPGVYFKRTKTQQLSIPSYGLVHVDIDQDGIKDLIGSSESGLLFYKGSVNGFDTPPVVTSFQNTIPIINKDAFADFNNDGKLDLVSVTFDSPNDSVTIYLNNGNGGFTAWSTTILQGLPVNSEYPVAVKDLNGDNQPDILTRDAKTTYGLYYRLLGIHNQFGPPTRLDWATNFKNLLVRDLNNDGKNDVIYTTSNIPVRIYTQINQGNGTFAFPNSRVINDSIHYGDNAIFADVNNDGRMDVVSQVYKNDADQKYLFSVFQFDNAGVITDTTVNATSALKRTIASVEFYDNSPRAGDFDGDGAADLMFFSRNTGTLFAKNTGGFNFTVQRFSSAGDSAPNVSEFSGDGKADLLSVRSTQLDSRILSVGFMQNVCNRQGQTKFVDFDGNGESDIGFWRPSDGRWMFYNGVGYTGFGSGVNFGLGSLGDIPVPQDYDGDDQSDYAVYRNSTGVWYIYRSSDGQFSIVQFGVPGDKPVPADFDGDGKADIALFRPSTGDWYGLPSSAPGTFFGTHWGTDGDVPLPMDYDGDSKADLAIYRPSTGGWYIARTGDGGYTIVTFGGTGGDRPVPADYDNDGRADPAVWRPNFAPVGINWYIATSRNLYGAARLGTNGDIPFVSVSSISAGSQSSPRPAIFHPADSSITIHPLLPFIFSGNSGNRNVSWILPVE